MVQWCSEINAQPLGTMTVNTILVEIFPFGGGRTNNYIHTTLCYIINIALYHLGRFHCYFLDFA